MFLLVILIVVVALVINPSTNVFNDQTNAALSSELNSLIKTDLPVFILLMTPVLGLVVQLFNIRKKRPFMEHFVFALHFAAVVEIFMVPKMLVSIRPIGRSSVYALAEWSDGQQRGGTIRLFARECLDRNPDVPVPTRALGKGRTGSS